MAGSYVTKAQHDSLKTMLRAAQLESETLKGQHKQLKKAADRMAAGIVVAMLATRELDQRSHAADAVLDYREDMTLAEAREILQGYE